MKSGLYLAFPLISGRKKTAQHYVACKEDLVPSATDYIFYSCTAPQNIKVSIIRENQI